MRRPGLLFGSTVLGLAFLGAVAEAGPESLVGWNAPDSNPASYEMRRDDRERVAGRFSGTIYLKSAGVTLWAGFWMRIDAATRRGAGFDNMNPRAIKGTTPWTRYEIVLDVPEDAVQIAFGILLAGGGQLWADELSLTAVDSRVPSTDLGFAPDYVPVEVDDGVPQEPRNLGFEE